MLNMSVHWWELVLRSAVVYSALIIILRVTGKRQVGQLAPFDLVLLLVLSNAVQNSMNGGDNSLAGGLISAVTLVTLNYLVGYATFKSKRIEAIVEGRPLLLIHNGRVLEDVLAHAKVTHHERIPIEMTSMDSASIAASMSRALATLADRIATQVR